MHNLASGMYIYELTSGKLVNNKENVAYQINTVFYTLNTLNPAS